MADSLLFDGVDDGIDCDTGGTPTWGPGWCAAIFKAPNFTGGQRIISINPSTGEGGMYRRAADGALSTYNGGESVGVATSNNVWYCAILSKASGAVVPCFHLYNYDTSSWSHNDGSSAIANSSPGAEVHLGHEGAAGFWSGNILIVGVGSVDLNDGAAEGLGLHLGWQKWYDANPVEAWRLNSMSAIQSFGTSGTADENSRTGTSLDTGDAPANWSDELTVRYDYSRFPKQKLRESIGVRR